MKRTFLFGMAIALSLPALRAQYDTIRLDQYKLPDIKRHQLDLSFNSSMNHGNETGPRYYHVNWHSNFNPVYSFYLNSDRYQSEISASLPFSHTLSKFATGTQDQVSNNFSGNPSITSNTRYYFKGLYFIESDINLESSLTEYSRTNKSLNDSSILLSKDKINLHDMTVDLEVPVLFGYGRIERVEDYRLVIYILDDLKKHDRLTRTPTHEEMLEMASVISKKKNERIFDSRIRKIEEIKAVDAFLKEKGLIKESDAVYFTSLRDNWDYSAGPVRYSGYRVFIGPSLVYRPYKSYQKNTINDFINDTSYSSESEMRYRSFGIGYQIGFEYNKPLNLYWQLSGGIRCDLYTLGFRSISKNGDAGPKAEEYTLVPSQFISLGYYPNSRTYSSLTLSTDQSMGENKKTGLGLPDDVLNKSFYPSASASWQMVYYFSPQLQVSANYELYLNSVRIHHNSASDIESSKFSNYIRFGIVYHLF